MMCGEGEAPIGLVIEAMAAANRGPRRVEGAIFADKKRFSTYF